MGEIEFSSGSEMVFSTETSSISLDWADTKKFAHNMREVADWLDEHEAENIHVNVD